MAKQQSQCKEVFYVQYLDKYGQVVLVSEEQESFEQADQLARSGRPQGYDSVVYAKIDKRVKYE